MAIMWNGSLIPWLDMNGNPYRGAKAYFFNANTTTPRAVYWDGELSNVHDHPVTANMAGMFPPIFMPSGTYRIRLEAEDGTTIWDVDDISAPAVSDVAPPDAGETSITLLARTGDLKARHGTGAHSGWVRAAGRTIGNALSGATERANADTEDLFTYLWAADPNLVVSGGRGSNAAADFASDKTIALPDYRNRVIAGLGDMGNANAARISNELFQSGDNVTLGSFAGVDKVTLTEAQTPTHTHTGTALPAGLHSHGVSGGLPVATGGGWTSRNAGSSTGVMSSSAGQHSHNLSLSSFGGSEAHTNVQPTQLATIYIKL